MPSNHFNICLYPQALRNELKSISGTNEKETTQNHCNSLMTHDTCKRKKKEKKIHQTFRMKYDAMARQTTGRDLIQMRC